VRGEVLHYDVAQGFGFITAVDGSRYTFSREDLRRDAPMSKGMAVEFQPAGSHARNVFSIRAQFGIPSVMPSDPAASPRASAASAPMAQQFGRAAASGSAGNASLWGYFWRGVTSNYVNFRDRARRAEYWSFYLVYLLVGATLVAIGVALDLAAGNLDEPDGAPYAALSLFSLYFLATFIPNLAINVRRIHDIGLSGWFYLLILLPYVGGLIIFVFSLIPSQKHENKWGAIPAGVRV
jgi:uncharacterized membrane protein YhaH (DUF805 family)/cold shock CspA family protein